MSRLRLFTVQRLSAAERQCRGTVDERLVLQHEIPIRRILTEQSGNTDVTLCYGVCRIGPDIIDVLDRIGHVDSRPEGTGRIQLGVTAVREFWIASVKRDWTYGVAYLDSVIGEGNHGRRTAFRLVYLECDCRVRVAERLVSHIPCSTLTTKSCDQIGPLVRIVHHVERYRQRTVVPAGGSYVHSVVGNPFRVDVAYLG